MSDKPIKARRAKLSDLRPAEVNPNAGNELGSQIIQNSIQFNGAGRSGLADKDGELLAGSQTYQAMMNAGIDDVIIVESDGHEWIVVQRPDVAATDPQGVGLKISDNRASELGYTPDQQVIAALLGDIREAHESAVQMTGYTNEQMAGLIEGKTDPYGEWVGMPEFEQESINAYHSIKVHFKTAEDLQAFAELVNQVITNKTVFIYYPQETEKVVGTSTSWIVADES